MTQSNVRRLAGPAKCLSIVVAKIVDAVVFAEAIKRANWAMKEDPACAQAHRRWLAAKLELSMAFRDALPAARAEYEAAKRDWYRLTEAVFDRVMADAAR